MYFFTRHTISCQFPLINNLATASGGSKEVSNNAANDLQNGLNRKSRGKQKKTGNKAERKHKSLSPEKRFANTLAQSMSSISKSFEKLDLVGQVSRKKSRSQGRSAPAVDDQHNHKKQRRRSRPPTDQVGTFLSLLLKKIIQICIVFYF